MADSIHTESCKDQVEVRISGQVTGDTQLPKDLPLQSQKLRIKFMDSCYINSSGIRTWMLWLTELGKNHPSLKIIFEGFPATFVRQAASINGFVPSGSTILSLRMPYYCENCNETHETLLEWGKDLNPNDSDQTLTEQISSQPCERCGNSAEIDAWPEHFLLTRPNSL